MAQRIATHYDNLKVMRDAPVDVIKASYRKLAQQYHPDRNPGADALHIMKTINQAWDVLSDPERRAKHDRWIADQEQRAMHGQPARPHPAPRAAAAPQAQSSRASVQRQSPWYANRIVIGAAAAVLLATASGVFLFQRPAAEAELNQVSDALVAGNGTPSFADSNAAAFVTAEEEVYGPARFEFNNTAGIHPVDARLFRDGKLSRSVFIPAGQRFDVNDLPLGTYTIHYRTVADGKERTFLASATFPLLQTGEELQSKQFDRFSKNRITMINFADGKATEIAAGAF